jgi:hypothetical protein
MILQIFIIAVCVSVTYKIIKNWQKIVWFLQDKCDDCGGNLSEHINGKFYCDDCDKLN